MTILLLKTLLLLLLTTIFGIGIVIWPAQRLRLNPLLLIGISFLLGIGLFGAILTSLIFAHGFEYSNIVVVILGVIGITSIILSLRRYGFSLVWRIIPRGSALVVLIMTLIIVAPVVLHSVLYPLTSWDAKMIWMMKAKALYVEPHVPNTLFESDLFNSAHKDYPLGFPAIIAGHYNWYGAVAEQPVAASYVAYWWAILVVAAGTIERVLGPRRRRALLFVGPSLILCLSAGTLLEFAGLGLADIPLASYFLAAGCSMLIGLSDSNKNTRISWLTLGLLFSGIGMTIKNEGVPFFILYLFFSVWTVLSLRKPQIPNEHAVNKGILRGLMPFLVMLAGVLVSVGTWQSLKMKNGYSVDLLIPIERTVSDYFFRGIDTAQWFIKEVPNFDHWGWGLLPALLLVIAIFVTLIKIKQSKLSAAPLLLVFGQAFVYYLIYVRSPHELTWHITTSLDRVFLHLVPSLFVLACSYSIMLYDRQQGQQSIEVLAQNDRVINK